MRSHAPAPYWSHAPEPPLPKKNISQPFSRLLPIWHEADQQHACWVGRPAAELPTFAAECLLVAGERMFVDYACATLEVIDPETGEAPPALSFKRQDIKAKVRWSHFAGQFGSEVKVYSGV